MQRTPTAQRAHSPPPSSSRRSPREAGGAHEARTPPPLATGLARPGSLHVGRGDARAHPVSVAHGVACRRGIMGNERVGPAVKWSVAAGGGTLPTPVPNSAGPTSQKIMRRAWATAPAPQPTRPPAS